MRFLVYILSLVFWASGAVASLGPADAENTGPQEERIFYFYHPDHLGSSSYVTDIDGLVFQHVEYFPFGETWVEEHSNRQRTPYLFTGKELDEDVQLYYFGARYYDPRTSVWQSPDPILAEYLARESQAGVQNPVTLGLYTYSQNRPVIASDPDGRETVFIGGAGDSGAYKQDFVRAMADAGMSNVRTTDPSVSLSIGGFLGDAALGVITFNNDMGVARLSIPQLRRQSTDASEQYNLVGYSWGAAIAAQQAVTTSDQGQVVDNLVLIGAPINQSLVDQIAASENIKNVIYVNLTEHGDAAYPGMSDAEVIWYGLTNMAPDMAQQQYSGSEDGIGHFYYSGTGAVSAARRDALAKQLAIQGLE